MAADKYDCIVIGSGPGGYVAAIRAAQLGLKTAVVEKGETGGRCLNEACIPAKSILRVAEVMSEVQHSDAFGISTGDVSFDYSGATKHRDKVVKTLTSGVAMLLDKNKIDLIEGFALGHRRRQREDRRPVRRDRGADRPGDPGLRLGGQAHPRSLLRPADPRHRGDVAAERAALAAVRDRRGRFRDRDRLRFWAAGHRGAAARGAGSDPAARGPGDREGVRAGDPQAERADRDRGQGFEVRRPATPLSRSPSTTRKRSSTTW